MDEKKLPCSGRQPIEQGSSKVQDTISQVSEKVKSEQDILQYFACILTRFSLQHTAQRVIRKLFPELKRKNYCKCHNTVICSIVDLKRNPETQRAYYNGICTCATPMLCPVCSPRIMGYRAAEIRQAVHAWLAEDPENTCYMITLTLRHSLCDTLACLLDLFKTARKYFWGHRTVKNLLKRSDLIGRITATEINFSIKNGWHPHQHILLFCKKSDFDNETLCNIWLAALHSVGLSGVGDIAFRLQDASFVKNYLTKMSSEMVLGALKDGRSCGSYAPFQLLAEIGDGSSWAVDRFVELFKATRRMHSLTWSKGLKARFGIGEVSDQEISDNKADKSKLVQFIGLLDDAFNSLTPQQKAMLINKAAVGDYSGAGFILKNAGIKADEVFA